MPTTSGPSDTAPPRTGATLRSIGWGLVLLNLLLVALCCWGLWLSWRNKMAEAERKTTATAHLLERGASATFDKARIALDGAADAIERQIAGGGLNEATDWSLIDRAAARVPEIHSIGAFDAAGRQLCGVPADRCGHHDISDRDYYSLLRARPDTPTQLLGPMPSRIDGLPSLLMARALRTPTQGFAGVVVAELPLARMQTLVAAARSNRNGMASLRNDKLEMIALDSDLTANPNLEGAAAVSDIFQQRRSQSPQAGVYRAVTARDGVERVLAYRRLPDYPVYVFVGEATADFLGVWWRTLGWTIGFSLIFVATTAAIYRVARTSAQRQDRAQRLYDEAPCGYHTLDREGRYLSINATELRWLGCTRAELMGQLRPTDFFTAASCVAFAANFPALQPSGQLDELELELVGRQGQQRHVLVSARAVHDAKGKFLLSNWVMTDITALHTARTALAGQSAEQQAMLDTDMAGMLRVREGRIVWKNAGLDRLFGYSGDEWAAMPVAQLFPSAAAHRRTADPVAALTHTDPHLRQQTQAQRKDGSIVWVDVSVLKLPPSGAESFTILLDITELKRAEALRLRGAELEVQNLALQEAGRLKSEFLMNMSHELRTPLNAVIGFSQLLEIAAAEALTDKLLSYVHQIGESGHHLLSLVETMLDFANVQSSLMSFAPETVNVEVALTEVAQMLEPMALAAQVSLRLALEDDLVRVVNDPLRLRQMVLNLAGNAVKFSKPGGVVDLRARALDAERWCVEVEDHGIGISAADMQRLFAPFVQFSSGMSKAYGGTGLGLALVRQIAQAQGGDVDVSSRLGEGSVFTLTLPRHLAAAAVR